ncbi:hypothetical protein [Streptomyces sp. SAS_276]|uniref:hypothetical protein n=1 Tax=Streptomyces sp. SAS_276 TaxID=3412745 RepID=UPI00403C7C84
MAGADGIGRFEGAEHWRSEREGDDDEFHSAIEQLESWLRGKPFNLHYQRSLSGGDSGAYVAVMQRVPHQRGRRERLIVKLVPPDEGVSETNNARAAASSVPEAFRSAHLVVLEAADELAGEGSWWIHMQKVVLGDLTVERAPRLLDLLDDEGIARYCAAIVKTVITKWDREEPAPVVTETPSEFLEKFLDPRLAGADVRAFLSEADIDLDAPAETIKLPGRRDLLPNPFALLKRRGDETPVLVFRGNSHGDLHVRNVLLPRTELGKVGEEEFKLIDLGRYSTSGPLSLDPMKLLLSIAAEWLPSLVPYSAIRSGLAEVMVAPGRCGGSPPVVGYRGVAQAIHTAAEQGLMQHGDREGWEKQNQLVLVGCALRYVARPGLATADRWWFLEVAALATRAFSGGSSAPKEDWTRPTESCATGRVLPGREERTQRLEVSDHLAEVIPINPRVRQNRTAAELAALIQEIERLPHDASAARLEFIAVDLRQQADDLAEALTDQRSTLLRIQLTDTSTLLSQFSDVSLSSGETVRRVQQAAKTLRTYARRLWPDEAG